MLSSLSAAKPSPRLTSHAWTRSSSHRLGGTTPSESGYASGMFRRNARGGEWISIITRNSPTEVQTTTIKGSMA